VDARAHRRRLPGDKLTQLPVARRHKRPTRVPRARPERRGRQTRRQPRAGTERPRRTLPGSPFDQVARAHEA
jgi:hypothetical protein